MKTMAAPANTQRLMTFVLTMMPTFWPKAEVGTPPNSDDRMETRPWAMMPPEISLPLGMRSMEPAVAAERSPMSWMFTMT